MFRVFHQIGVRFVSIYHPLRFALKKKVIFCFFRLYLGYTYLSNRLSFYGLHFMSFQIPSIGPEKEKLMINVEV